MLLFVQKVVVFLGLGLFLRLFILRFVKTIYTGIAYIKIMQKSLMESKIFAGKVFTIMFIDGFQYFNPLNPVKARKKEGDGGTEVIKEPEVAF